MAFVSLLKLLAYRGAGAGIEARRGLSQYGERGTAPRSVAKDGEMVVKRCHSFEPEALHYSETGKIDNRKVLVTPGCGNLSRLTTHSMPRAISDSSPERTAFARACPHLLGRARGLLTALLPAWFCKGGIDHRALVPGDVRPTGTADVEHALRTRSDRNAQLRAINRRANAANATPRS
jgi:hypothetical protein